MATPLRTQSCISPGCAFTFDKVIKRTSSTQNQVSGKGFAVMTTKHVRGFFGAMVGFSSKSGKTYRDGNHRDERTYFTCFGAAPNNGTLDYLQCRFPVFGFPVTKY